MSASRILGLMVVSAWLAVGCSGAKKIDVGGTCILNSDCNSPLVCTMGKCHDACHTSADCPTGQSCVNTNDATICQLPAEGECSAALPCGGTLVCASDQHCRTPCQSRTDCTTEQICVSGVCAAPAELDPNNQLPQSGPGSNTDGGTVNPVPDALPSAQPDAGAGPIPWTCAAGPDGWCWSIYTHPSTTAGWVAPASASSAHASLTAEPASINIGNAGVGFTFAAGRPAINLARFDRIVFTATASMGFEFSVASSDTAGCSMNFSGDGTKQTYTAQFSMCTPYSMDSTQPAFSLASI